MPHNDNQRQQVRSGIEEPRYRPGASPVDRFVRPDAGEKLSQLASALSEVEPALARFAQTRKKKEDEEAVLEAEAAAEETLEQLRERNLSLQEAQRQGLIEEYENPFAQMAYQEQIGKALGERAFADWRVQKEQNLSEATSLEEYDGEYDRFLSDYEENLGQEMSPLMEQAFRRRLRRRVQQDRTNFSGEIGQRLENLNVESFHVEINEGATNLLHEGATVPEIVEWGQRILDGQIEAVGATPGKKRQLNRTFARAIAAAAERAALQESVPGDGRRLLEALWQVELGEGPLGATGWGGQIIEEAYDRYDEEAQQQERIRQRSLQEEYRAANTSALQEIRENGPNADLSEQKQTIEDLSSRGLEASTARTTIRQWNSMVDAASRRNQQSDPDTLDQLGLAIRSNPAGRMQHRREVNAALNNGNLSFRDWDSLHGIIDREYRTFVGGSEDEDPIVEIHDYEFYSRRLDSRFDTSTAAGKARRDRAQEIYNDLSRQWVDDNPDADSLERSEAFQDMFQQSLNAMQAPHDRAFIENTVPSADVPIEWLTDEQVTRDEFTLLHTWAQDGFARSSAPGNVLNRLKDIIGTPSAEKLSNLYMAQKAFHSEITAMEDDDLEDAAEAARQTLMEGPGGQEQGETEEEEEEPEALPDPAELNVDDLSDTSRNFLRRNDGDPMEALREAGNLIQNEAQGVPQVDEAVRELSVLSQKPWMPEQQYPDNNVAQRALRRANGFLNDAIEILEEGSGAQVEEALEILRGL